MEGEERNYDSRSQNTRLIDPDLAVIAELAFAGISAIVGLYPIVSCEKSKKERKKSLKMSLLGLERQ